MNMETVGTDKNPPMEATAPVKENTHAYANEQAKKRKNHLDNASEKVLIGTFVSQITICLIIVLGFLISLFHPSSTASTSPSESITLSLIGMAISVWIGLNIYNTISKDDLHTLKENLLQLTSELELRLDAIKAEATEAKKSTEQVYIEILKSKFRMSSYNTASKYFAVQMDTIGSFPTDVYEEILNLEDLFQISYHLYGKRISSQDNLASADSAKKLTEKAHELKDNGTIKNKQYNFLMGYANWRWGDFLYYIARYDTSIGSHQKKDYAKDAIAHYKSVLEHLFSIKEISGFDQYICTNANDKVALCYLANDIAATYIDIIGVLSKKELNDAIIAERFAVKNSEEIPDRVREKFIRNLGCAYEKKNDDKEAFRQYRNAYKTFSGNSLCAHCIGSLYRKQAMRHFHRDLPLQELAKKDFADIRANEIYKLDDAEKDELEQQLKRAVYWYTIEQSNNYGKAEPRLVELNDFLYRLTKNRTYKRRKQEAEEHCDYANEILKSKDKHEK